MSDDLIRGIGTRCLHAGQEPDPATNARAVPIYATTSFTFNDTDHAAALFGLTEFGNIYSRLMNPTVDVLEKRLAALDGGVTGLALLRGQAAITAAILTLTHAGQNIVSATSLYGGTWTLFTQTFKKMGIEVRFLIRTAPEDIHALVDENTRLVYMESLGNPKNDVPDFQAIADAAHSAPHGALPVLCDNTVMTPCLLRPFEHGIDINIYSTTKFIGGHGTHIGGAIVDSGNFKWADQPQKWPELCGPSPSYHGAIFEAASPRDGKHLLPGSYSHALVARYGRRDEPVCRFPVPAGTGNAPLCGCHDTAKMRWRLHKLPGRAFPSRVGKLSRTRLARRQRDRAQVPARWPGSPAGIWNPGRHRCGQGFYQRNRSLFPLGQYRGRKNVGNPPRVNDAPATFCRGTGQSGRDARLHPHLCRH